MLRPLSLARRPFRIEVDELDHMANGHGLPVLHEGETLAIDRYLDWYDRAGFTDNDRAWFDNINGTGIRETNAKWPERLVVKFA
jgi:hypothetical protein